MQKIKLNKKLQLWNCATSGQTYLLQKIKSFFKVLLTVNLFKLFYWRHGIAHKSTKFIISSKFIIKILSQDIFHKKLSNICHSNCSLIVPCLAILKIKMFHHIACWTYLCPLYYLSFSWIKFHVEIYATWSSPNLTMFLQKLSN